MQKFRPDGLVVQDVAEGEVPALENRNKFSDSFFEVSTRRTLGEEKLKEEQKQITRPFGPL